VVKVHGCATALQVDPPASKHELLKSKTEIRLKKSDAIKWPTLEKSNQKADAYAKAPTAIPTPPVQQPKPAYPSSFNKKTVDWYAAVVDFPAASSSCLSAELCMSADHDC
jgi:hypothetical protein